MYLKKYLEMLGLGVLICFSFILTDKTSTIMKENDEIMATIKENYSQFETSSIDAKINNDEIIPGISGKQVDIESSYQVMKKIGKYHSDFLVYKDISPTVTLENNYNKYITGGNPARKAVSFIFKVYNNTNISALLKILKQKEVTANFFLDGKWLEQNYEKLTGLVNNNHLVGNLGYNKEYGTDNDYWFVSNIKRNTKQKKYYCYCEIKNDNSLSSCAKLDQYTIIPSIIVKDDLLINVKQKVQSGSIISVELTDYNISELSLTIDYIRSKGYEINTLDMLLDE